MLNSRLFYHLLLGAVFNCCLLTASCGQSYKFDYKSVPKNLHPSPRLLNSYFVQNNAEKNSNYDITYSLPKNHVKDGSVDYTTYLQRALNLHKRVIFPNFPVLVNERGLTLSSNSVVIFQEKSKIILAANDKPNYQVLRIFNVENLKVFYPVIEGDRFKHKSKLGEWGMGISIAGSKNIEIINPKVSNCWGDGIYIGRISSAVNYDIRIYYAQLDNNRRNGVSLICVNGLILESPLISNTNGTLPMTGIDIEPNSNKDEIDNIRIINPVTFNNASNGMSFVISALVQDNSKKIDVEIVNHADFYSKNALDFYFGPAQVTGRNIYSQKRRIKIVNPKWYYNFGDRFVNFKKSTKGLDIIIENPIIYKAEKGLPVINDNALRKLKEKFQ